MRLLHTYKYIYYLNLALKGMLLIIIQNNIHSKFILTFNFPLTYADSISDSLRQNYLLDRDINLSGNNCANIIVVAIVTTLIMLLLIYVQRIVHIMHQEVLSKNYSRYSA